MATNLQQPDQQVLQPLIAAFQSGQMPQVEKIASKLLKKYPHGFMVHNLLGNAQAAQGKTVAAIKSFKQALKVDPRVAELHLNVGMLSGQLGKTDDAIAGYQHAVKLNPALTDAHYNLGIALQAKSDLVGAAASYQNAIKNETGFFEAHTNLGTVLQRQGDLAGAVTSYQKALAITTDALTFYSLGTALKNQGELEKSALAFKQAIAMKADYADAFSSLGAVRREQSEFDDALKCYQKAIELAPDHPEANYNFGVLLYDMGNLEKALKHFSQSQFHDWQERSLYCLYKSEVFEDFEGHMSRLIKKAHTSPFLATLSSHYALNFGKADPYSFCKRPLDAVFHFQIPELKGDSPLLKALLHDIETVDIAEKQQGRLHYGKQSAGNIFKRPEASFRELGEVMKGVIARYRDTLVAQEPDCEFAKQFPQDSDIEFSSSWYVRMEKGGHLDSHIHEEGWVSGAIYLAIPEGRTGDEGSIEASMHGDDYPKKHENFPSKTIAPDVGDTVMFPSSVFHRTIPFSTDELRICIAFDVKPVVSSA